MKILVTGAGGFLGKRVVRSLLRQRPAYVRLTGRSGATTSLDQLRTEFPDTHLELITGNLADREFAKAATQDVEVVYHLAAGTQGNPAEVIYNTLVASDNLFTALHGSAVKRVVLVSSFAVYGVGQMRWNDLLDENSPIETHPERRDPYTYAKWRQEALLREHKLPGVIVRPGVIYGEGGSPMSVRIGLNVGPLFLHLGGRNRLPLTYVENCADAVVLAGLVDGIEGETFNIVDDETIRANRYRKLYARKVRRLKSIIVPYPVLWLLGWTMLRYHHASNGQLPAAITPYKVAAMWKKCRFDNSKAKRLLGWQPQVRLDDALERTFQFHRQRVR